MNWLRQILIRLQETFGKRRREGVLDEELQTHLALLIERNIARGMSAEEARRTAKISLGSAIQIRESVRDDRGLPLLETLWQDVRYALRILRKSPAFTAVAVLTLALGIGANTAIFSVVDAVLLKPLPYANPNQLVRISLDQPKQDLTGGGFSYPYFSACRKQTDVFSQMAGNVFHQLTLTGAGEPTEVDTSIVTPEVFSMLQAKPLIGRTFISKDGEQGAAPVVVVSENLWRSRFGADPNLLGRSITLDKRAFTVIGVMPAGFHFPTRMTDPDEVWIPLVQDPLFGPWMNRQGGHWLRVTARLKAGVSIAQAQAALAPISARLSKEDPADNSGWTMRVEPLQTAVVGDSRTPLLILLGAVALVLLIACANLANLLLSRATSRAKELAVRMALGASRVRIARQLLTESVLLGLLGGIAGILLAYWGVSALLALIPGGLPRADTIHVDGWVLLFALALSLAAGLFFGLAPALLAGGSAFQSTLKESSMRSGESAARRRARGFLVSAQVSLALILLVGAGLLLRSFEALSSVNPGFDSRHVVMANIALPRFQYAQPAQWEAFGRESLDKIQSLPGMSDSALAVPVPMVDGFINLAFGVAGAPPLPPGVFRLADYASVSPNYFHVMQIPLLRGRLFSAQDSLSAPRVAIISEALARQYFPNEDPLGQTMKFGFPPDGAIPRQIVGIVGDVRDVAFNKKPGPMMYAPFAQAPFWGEDVVVRSSLSTSAVAAGIRQATHAIDKDLPVTNILSLPDALTADPSVAQPRFRAFLLGLFSGIALLLAAVGIFGVISYSVARRTHELGIRLALGAQPNAILGMVLRETLALVLIGIAVGLPCAFAASQLVTHLLFSVKSYDPITLILVPLVLLAVGALAGCIPARRAMRVDPMIALRYE